MGENPCPVGWGTLCPGDPKEHWPPSMGTPNSQALRVGPSKSTQPWLHQNAPPPALQTAQGSSVFPRPWLWGGCQGGCRPRWLSGPAPWQGAVGTSEPHRLLGLANRVVPICSSATWCPPAPAKPQEPALTLHTQVPSLRMSPAPEVTNKT